MRIVIFKSMHMSLPPIFRVGDNIRWEYEISVDSTYDHGDSDQDDRNKLLGIKAHYFKPKQDSIMVSYSWNLKTQKNDLSFYWHVNGGREWSDVLSSVERGEMFRVGFSTGKNYQEIYFIVRGKKYSKSFELPFDKWYLINAWFGGNRTPNEAQRFTIKKVK